MGRQTDLKLGMRILLYSYCKVFHADPNTAQHTPMEMMMDMLLIHGEAEKIKSDEMDNMKRRSKSG